MRAGKWCAKCGERLYLVQNRDGERFLVGTRTGTRWCKP